MSISFEGLEHVYSINTPFSFAALNGVDLNITEGKVTAIVGETGSGKSTLVQHLNALLLPTSGKLTILDRVINSTEKPEKLKSLRKDVGLVFQFPEYQLFEETILKDVAFGPKNFNINEDEAIVKAEEALNLVGIDKGYFEKSPLDLSGGQKRRVAIAGILAMDPKILVLDEPTAGLDPQGAKQMMSLFMRLNNELNKTVLIVTHDMEHVLNYCDEVVVMKNGKVHSHMKVDEFFMSVDLLKEMKILPPSVVSMKILLNEKGFNIPKNVLSIDELIQSIRKEVQNG